MLAYLTGEPALLLATALTGPDRPSAQVVECIIGELVDRVGGGAGPALARQVQTLHRAAL
ncbi:hypothetical protein ACWFOB_23220 [Bacillus subtilis]